MADMADVATNDMADTADVADIEMADVATNDRIKMLNSTRDEFEWTVRRAKELNKLMWSGPEVGVRNFTTFLKQCPTSGSNKYIYIEVFKLSRYFGQVR